MEEVLDLYKAAPDPLRPTVCFDELPYQLVAEARCPVPARPGRPARVDYEYRRAGTANVFLCFDPARGWRRVHVTDRRTKRDFAHAMQALVDEDYPEAAVIRLVSDNLNTHTPAALYETFPPAEARRIARKLEFHHTPKHGSWLNMAEIELSVLSGQCLDRRLGGSADPRTGSRCLGGQPQSPACHRPVARHQSGGPHQVAPRLSSTFTVAE
jgi:hypothetical protein